MLAWPSRSRPWWARDWCYRATDRSGAHLAFHAHATWSAVRDVRAPYDPATGTAPALGVLEDGVPASGRIARLVSGAIGWRRDGPGRPHGPTGRAARSSAARTGSAMPASAADSEAAATRTPAGQESLACQPPAVSVGRWLALKRWTRVWPPVGRRRSVAPGCSDTRPNARRWRSRSTDQIKCQRSRSAA